MRKIYPSPSNKFAKFVFYSLLSIAVITLAQDEVFLSNDCAVPKPMLPKTPRVMVGYVPLFTNQLSPTKDIPWDLYDYINVIGKKN